jgi:hypothetical protein
MARIRSARYAGDHGADTVGEIHTQSDAATTMTSRALADTDGSAGRRSVLGINGVKLLCHETRHNSSNVFGSILQIPERGLIPLADTRGPWWP